ncbi:MAG: hypothetical protein IPG61_09545 [bacterium]|nr:hypothetical protein [bacterium]
MGPPNCAGASRRIAQFGYFYWCDAANAKLQPLVAEISWAKNLVIFSHCKDDLAREFYLRAAACFGWAGLSLHRSLSPVG